MLLNTHKTMTDVMNEIKKTNEDAESIQKRKNTRRKKANRAKSIHK
jgi:hypothetical protein